MVAAAATSPQLHFSSPRSSTRLLPSVFDSKAVVSSSSCPSSVVKRIHVAAAAGVRCMAVGTAVSEAAETKKKKSVYEIERLTNWLLKKEQAGVIDAELTIGAANVQGEHQKKLDVVSNEVFSNCLRSSGRTGIIASEEEDVPVAVEEIYSGNHIVVFDPLDGSSNIDAAVSTGCIFSIHSLNDECFADIGDDANVRVSTPTPEKCLVV